MEITTGPLTREQMDGELKFIVEFLKTHSASAKYMYGWGCNLPIDDLWQTHDIAMENITNKVQESIAAGIFSLGEADFYIYDAEERFHFLLCHEGDVHFTSEHGHLFALVRSAWENRYEKVFEVKSSPSRHQ